MLGKIFGPEEITGEKCVMRSFHILRFLFFSAEDKKIVFSDVAPRGLVEIY
jgi:hypothetical protein